MRNSDAARIVLHLNQIQATFAYLEARGIARAQAIALLERAEAEQRPVTIEEAQGELDKLQSEIDATRDLIDDEPEDTTS